MGRLFQDLCKGPVVVIDDMIGKDDPIDDLITEIKKENLPIIQYTNLAEAMSNLEGMLLSNFIILDWEFRKDIPLGVGSGSTAESWGEEKVIEFIKKVQQICLAPIFIISSWDKKTIVSKLNDGGIETEGENYVFVETKNNLCKDGRLISKIEEWMRNPHIYLYKWWTNNLIFNNTQIFWELCDLDPEWPSRFYHSFEEGGDDPLLALRDSLSRLILSQIDVTSINKSLIAKKIEKNGCEEEALKRLYGRLVYTNNNIDRDIRPGDVFERTEDGKKRYYLNIRPECDTTKRAGNDPELYLLKGEIRRPKSLKKGRYDSKRSIIVEWEDEIILLHLDGNDIVQFNKKNLLIKKQSELEKTYLFSIDKEEITAVEDNLNKGVIADNLKKAFKNNKNPLSDNVTISKETWGITDEEKVYIIKKEDKKLNIYEKTKCKKVCRILPPFITKYMQSYVNYLGRFGVPSYPKQIVDSVFKSRKEPQGS